jgi:hypothetical protein
VVAARPLSPPLTAHTGEKGGRKPQWGWWLGDWGFVPSLAFEVRWREGQCKFLRLPPV